jgi:hypothetical protein
MTAIATGFRSPLPAGYGYSLTQDHNERSQFLYDSDSGFEYHIGEDWANGAANAEGPALATANGIVIRAGNVSSWGNIVVVKHTLPDGSTVSSIYGHLASIYVSVGQDVSIGQELGLIGDGGFSTGAHLHFGIYLGDLTGIVPIGLVQDNPDPDPNNSGYVDPSNFLTNHPGPVQPDLDARNGDPDFAATLSASSVAQGTDVTITYRVSSWGPGNAPGSSSGIYLSANNVFDTGDTLLTTDAVGALAANVGSTETATFSTSSIAAGNYFIFAVADYNNAIAEANETNNPSNGVALTVTSSPPPPPPPPGDDYPANANTSGVVTPGGGQVVGNIETAADRDWFRLQVSQGLTYTINLVNGSPPQSSPFLADPEVYLYNASSQLVASNDDFGGLNSQLTFTAAYTGNYFVGAGEHGDNDTGTYRLSVAASPPPPPPPPPPPGPSGVSINDVSITEGNSGTKLLTFTVSRTGGTAAFDVNYATSDGGAMTADSDYVATSGTLNFGTNVNTQTVSVTINGDTKFELDEAFFVSLSGASNGATISDSQGLGTIVNDDPLPAGSVSINDVSVTEGDSGTKQMTFTVTRTGGTAAFAVNYATANGTATSADGDYNSAFGTLNFGANVNSLPVTVTINGDTKFEPDQTFFINLTGATNGAAISDSQGQGTIINDDSPASDFGGDGKSDVLWRNDNGQVYGWQMNGLTIGSEGAVRAPDATWHIQDTGDFGGDGRSDVLWRNDNGQVYIWQMNGLTIGPEGYVRGADASWHVQGTGDFGGDGKSDVLWRNDNGQVYIWQMNGSTIASEGFVRGADASWRIQGTGDFDGDGKSDLLWRNTSGQVYIWEMDGLGIKAEGYVRGADLSWHIQDTGDFNGDGRSDVLWRNDNGQVYIWEMNGLSILAEGAVRGADNTWHVQGTGDFNGDGRDDVSWRNDNGQAYLWQMNGLAIGSEGAVRAADNSWHMVGHHFDLV